MSNSNEIPSWAVNENKNAKKELELQLSNEISSQSNTTTNTNNGALSESSNLSSNSTSLAPSWVIEPTNIKLEQIQKQSTTLHSTPILGCCCVISTFLCSNTCNGNQECCCIECNYKYVEPRSCCIGYNQMICIENRCSLPNSLRLGLVPCLINTCGLNICYRYKCIPGCCYSIYQLDQVYEQQSLLSPTSTNTNTNTNSNVPPSTNL